MASRYLNNGQWSFTLLTRLFISTLTPSGFISTDVGRTIFFVNAADNTVYWGTIQSVTNSTTIILNETGNLPLSNKTNITGIVLLYDFGLRRTYGNYISAIDSLVKDEASKLTSSDKIQSINNALVDYGKDRPYTISKLISFNGMEYNLLTTLGALWSNEYSRIISIECLSSEIDGYEIYDDGTAQDGSNLKLKFSQLWGDFIVKFTTERKIPIDTVPNFPDTNDTFNNILLLGAMYQCLMLASAFAQSIDSSISADAVNYNEKTNKYISLAKTYYKRYCLNVFGAEEPTDNVKSGVVSHNIDVQSSMNTPSLFHSRKGL